VPLGLIRLRKDPLPGTVYLPITREAPLGQNLEEMLIGMMVLVGGQPRGSEGT
jgi:hypothetical protein